MPAAPPEPKQRLIGETKVPAGGWPSHPEGADPEIARLRHRLDRAERETRTTRVWAWMMFALALTSGLTSSLLATRVGNRPADESSLQVLLRTPTARQRGETSPVSAPPAAPTLPAAPPLPASTLPVPPPKPVASLTRPESRRSPAAAPRVTVPVRPAPRRPQRLIPSRPTAPLPSVASSFSSFRTERPTRSHSARTGTAVQRSPLRKADRALSPPHRPRQTLTRTPKPRRPLNHGYRRVSHPAATHWHWSAQPWRKTTGSTYHRSGWQGSRPALRRSRWSWRRHGSSSRTSSRRHYHGRQAAWTQSRTRHPHQYRRHTGKTYSRAPGRSSRAAHRSAHSTGTRRPARTRPTRKVRVRR